MDFKILNYWSNTFTVRNGNRRGQARAENENHVSSHIIEIINACSVATQVSRLFPQACIVCPLMGYDSCSFHLLVCLVNATLISIKECSPASFPTSALFPYYTYIIITINSFLYIGWLPFFHFYKSNMMNIFVTIFLYILGGIF